MTEVFAGLGHLPIALLRRFSDGFEHASRFEDGPLRPLLVAVGFLADFARVHAPFYPVPLLSVNNHAMVRSSRLKSKASISPEVRERFSKRRAQIEAALANTRQTIRGSATAEASLKTVRMRINNPWK